MSKRRRSRGRKGGGRESPAAAPPAQDAPPAGPPARPRGLQARRLAACAGLCLAGAGLTCVSFPPADLWPVAWCALVPLLLGALWAPSWKSSLVLSIGAALVFFLAGLVWVTPVTVGGWIALSAVQSAFFAMPVVLARRWRRRFPGGWPVAFAAAWAGAELVRTWAFSGFPWLLLGYTQHRLTGLIQLAAVTGVYGVSFVIVLVNATLAELVLSLSEKRAGLEAPVRRAALVAGVAIAGAAACGLIGMVVASRLVLTEGPVVGVVQQNIPRLVSDMALPPEIAAIYDLTEAEVKRMSAEEVNKLQARLDAYYDEGYAKLRAEIDKAARLSRTLRGRGVRLLAWPETTVQVPLNRECAGSLGPRAASVQNHAFAVLDELSQSMDCHLLIGAQSLLVERLGEGPVADYNASAGAYANSAFFFAPEGSPLGRYDKMHLVPFGEYVPLGDWLPFLRKLTPLGERELTAGNKAVVFELPPPQQGADPAGEAANNYGAVRFGVLICYEDVFPALARRFRRRGAQFLMNLSDEGWYGRLGERRQHLPMAVFRAVETRTTVVRAANTGISCFIDPRGRVYAGVGHEADGRGLARDVEGAAAAHVMLSGVTTPYVLLGDAFAWLCLIAAGLALLPGPLLRRKARDERGA
ncbi:MAG: apolipoprotein N-acyltransferase [Candidatus Brocadiia bacterium]|nr:apolipoprotein N-acyltransferase [Candidatus Brocadiia bacterium]